MKTLLLPISLLLTTFLTSFQMKENPTANTRFEYSISDTINIDQEILFNIISNFEEYHKWNSLIPEAKGKLRIKEKLHLKILHDGKLRDFKPKVIAIDSMTGFTLSKSMLLRAIVLKHEFKINPISENQCILTQKWMGKGWIAKASWNKFIPLFEAFRTYNEDLKKYVDSLNK